MKNIKVDKRKLIVWSLGLLIGALMGYLYWNYYGCEDTCTIRSSPFNITVYGAVMGGLLADLINGFLMSEKKP